ncbi:hypothetical protein ACFL40_04395, partial [candidate division KSB1 bacterium]
QIEKDFTEEELQYKQEFLDYWRETKPNGKKEHWQMEKTFDVNLRFKKWLRNKEEWKGTNNNTDNKAEVKRNMETQTKIREIWNRPVTIDSEEGKKARAKIKEMLS